MEVGDSAIARLTFVASLENDSDFRIADDSGIGANARADLPDQSDYVPHDEARRSTEPGLPVNCRHLLRRAV